MDDAKLLELFRDGEDFDPIFEGRVEGLRAVAAAAWEEAYGPFKQEFPGRRNPYRAAVLVPAQEDK